MQSYGPGTVYLPNCPTVPYFVFSSLVTLCFVLFNVFWMVMAFEAYGNRSVWRLTVVVVTHFVASASVSARTIPSPPPLLTADRPSSTARAIRATTCCHCCSCWQLSAWDSLRTLLCCTCGSENNSRFFHLFASSSRYSVRSSLHSPPLLTSSANRCAKPSYPTTSRVSPEGTTPQTLGPADCGDGDGRWDISGRSDIP